MRSAEFEQLASLCDWIISASACEGQPGATLECMAFGLIPILTAQTNIDIENFGMLLPENSIADIQKTILAAAEMDIDECRKRSRLAASVVRENYTPEKFNSNLKNAIERIMAADHNVF
jgi:hypothetical protein